MLFSHLRLKNWRNFTAVDVPLVRRMFVVGPNAIGKSNLLDVFRFLRDLTVEGGGLATAVNRQRRGLSKLRSLHQKGMYSDVEIDVEVADGDTVWRYELAFNRQGLKKKITIPVVTREVVHCTLAGQKPRRLLNRPDDDDNEDPALLTQTALQQVAQNQEFRALAVFFSSVSYLHLVPQLIREEQRAAADSLGGDQYGRDLLSQIKGTPKNSQTARINKIGNVLKIAVPNFTKLSLVFDEENRPHLQAAFQHWRGPAAKQDEREFSDGTLRLIGLLWALQERSGPLLLEEPELSLHASIVRQLAPFIARAQRGASGRQALISTHSDDLMSDPGIGPNEILLVRPAREGSEVVLGADVESVREALEGGLSAADAVMPITANADMSKFGRTEI